MKLYSINSVCFSKVFITVVAFAISITAAKASIMPASISPSHKYIVENKFANISSGVVYASIDAMANDKSVIVKWITAAEQNNSHFEVERSSDMKNFKTVAFILDGFIANGTGKTYQFKENAGEVKNGKTVFYRLKQIDNDGTISYSTVMAVHLATKEANAMMQVMPNPLAENLTVRVNSIETGLAEIRIVSLSGQTLLSKQSTITKGFSNILVEGLQKLTPGMYMAQLIVNGTVIDNQKIIKD